MELPVGVGPTTVPNVVPAEPGDEPLVGLALGFELGLPAARPTDALAPAEAETVVKATWGTVTEVMIVLTVLEAGIVKPAD